MMNFLASVRTKEVALTPQESYVDLRMRKQRTLSAATTLRAFGADTLVRLAGASPGSVRRWLAELVERGLLEKRFASRAVGSGPRRLEYAWTPHGRATVQAELASDPEARRAQADAYWSRFEPGTFVELYEDPTESSLQLAAHWIEAADGARDLRAFQRFLDLADAEVRTLRSFLSDPRAEDVETLEGLSRRLERLRARRPVEVLRANLRRRFVEAVGAALGHVSPAVEPQVVSEKLLDEQLALVFNGTRRTLDALGEVERAVTQIGGSCVVFDFASTSRPNRLKALEALAPVLTGAASADLRVFVLMASQAETASRRVFDDILAVFGDGERLGGAISKSAGSEMESLGDLSVLLSATIAASEGDWLPRGLAKRLLLRASLERFGAGLDHGLARATLNDPVILDCVDRTGEVSDLWSLYSYHQVELDRAAAIRGLVWGSFDGPPELGRRADAPDQEATQALLPPARLTIHGG